MYRKILCKNIVHVHIILLLTSTVVKYSGFTRVLAKMSTQYLLEYFVNTQYSVLTRVLRLSTRPMSDVYIVSEAPEICKLSYNCHICINRLVAME